MVLLQRNVLLKVCGLRNALHNSVEVDTACSNAIDTPRKSWQVGVAGCTPERARVNVAVVVRGCGGDAICGLALYRDLIHEGQLLELFPDLGGCGARGAPRNCRCRLAAERQRERAAGASTLISLGGIRIAQRHSLDLADDAQNRAVRCDTTGALHLQASPGAAPVWLWHGAQGGHLVGSGLEDNLALKAIGIHLGNRADVRARHCAGNLHGRGGDALHHQLVKPHPDWFGGGKDVPQVHRCRQRVAVHVGDGQGGQGARTVPRLQHGKYLTDLRRRSH